MAKLKRGDRVDCRIKSSVIVSPYREYDETRTFEIVATDEHGYYLYVPHYFLLKDSVVVNASRCKSMGIDKVFIGENIVYIQENMVCRVHDELDGMKCSLCGEFYPYAEPNQEDGETLICYACRENPYR